MQAVCLGVTEKMGFQLLEFNGEADHVHLLVEYPPAISVSALVNALWGLILGRRPARPRAPGEPTAAAAAGDSRGPISMIQRDQLKTSYYQPPFDAFACQAG